MQTPPHAGWSQYTSNRARVRTMLRGVRICTGGGQGARRSGLLRQVENQRFAGTAPVEADCLEVGKRGAAAEAGLGVTLLPTFIVGESLRAGRLQAVLEDYCPPDLSINAVYPSRRFLAAKVRSFVDFIAEAFAGEPAWDRRG